MKKAFRMVFFSLCAILITSLWNKGFVIDYDWFVVVKSAILIAAIFYLIIPLSKVILLPLNILSLGLVSTIVYCFIFYFLSRYFSLIEIKSWIFDGGSLLGITIGKINISQISNVFISALSISTIINLLEKIL